MTESDVIVRANLFATGVFVVSSGLAALIFDGPWKVQGVVVALVLFAVGVAAFLWGYWAAVQRSREVEMSVAELYFLMGAAIPKRIKQVMLGCLSVQVVAALVTAIARPSTPAADGRSSRASAGSGSQWSVGSAFGSVPAPASRRGHLTLGPIG